MGRLVLRSVFFLLAAAGLLLGCSDDDPTIEAPVRGTITVADSVDSSGDYSGIGVTIIKKDSAGAAADTLFNGSTDAEGDFSGTAEFPRRSQYLMLISRNNRNLGRAGVILAEDDTLSISAQLPGLSQTLQINSREHKALATYQRVERGFRRIGAFARAGRLKGDSLAKELEKWPDIYWGVYEAHEQTLAGELAAQKTIELLNEWDKPAMMQKVRQIDDTDLAWIAATYGKQYLAQENGLDATLAYLDSIATAAENSETAMRIQMQTIELLYDSARVEKARQALQSFENTYSKKEMATEWAGSMRYDINYLSPGDPIPEFSFIVNGRQISREGLKGRPYLLELTSLKSPLYQQQFDRTMVIHSIYKNYDFEVVTIPLDSSSVTVSAFFDERMRPWPVAPAGAFNTEELQEKFNINVMPTRFLVDQQGRIKRRYIGQDYSEVLKDIQQLLKGNKNL